MPGLYDVMENRVNQAAAALDLPLGWEGKPFVVPPADHLRAKIVIASSTAASLGKNGLNKIIGRIEISVVTRTGENSLAAALAGSVAREFPRGGTFAFETGTGTFTTPACGAPVSDGKRSTALVTLNFYAFGA